MTIGLVTDSTAALPPGSVTGIPHRVVPLVALSGEEAHHDGSPQARRLTKGITTSRPAPAAFLRAYDALAAEGVDGIVSLHLSAALSGTADAATLAARDASVPVRVVDSAAIGLGLGFAVVDAARAATAGAGLDGVADAGLATARSCRTYVVVSSLEPLRRGGRVALPPANPLLVARPLLELRAGRVELLHRERTFARALARLTELAAPGADDRLAVHHVGAPERAEALAEHLQEAYGRAAAPVVVEVGTVTAAHLGKGALAVVVAPPGASIHTPEG